MSFFRDLGKLALTPSVVLGNLISKQVSSSKAQQSTEKLIDTAGGKVLSSAIIGTSAGLLVASGGASAIATKIASTSTTTKIVGGFVAPSVIVGGTKFLSNHPEAIYKAPQTYIKGSTGLIDIANNPSVGTVKTYVKENPIASGVIGAGLLYVGGSTLLKGIPAFASLRSGEATQEQTKAIKEQTKVLQSQGQYIPPELNKDVSKAVEKQTQAIEKQTALASTPKEIVQPKPSKAKKKTKKKKAKKKVKKKSKKKKKKSIKRRKRK